MLKINYLSYNRCNYHVYYGIHNVFLYNYQLQVNTFENKIYNMHITLTLKDYS